MEILGGPLFGVAGAGESHGPGMTTIVFGCPPGVQLSRTAVQPYLDRRRPGSNRHGTPRNEKDKLLLLSGIYQPDHDALTSGPAIEATVDESRFGTTTYEAGFSTGEPIATVVLSTSSKSRHYDQFVGETGEVRPGHTDLVKHHQSGGFVDIRGGGRSSYRSAISDVIGGSIARLVLEQQFGTQILSSIRQVGDVETAVSLHTTLNKLHQRFAPHPVPAEEIEALLQQLEASEIYSLDAEFAKQAGELIKQTRIAGDSLGASLEVAAINVPSLVGEPLYNSLKLRLMGSLGGLHAVRSCEVGAGTAVVSRHGSDNNDPIRQTGYAQNNHGGMLGGITTGAPLLAKVGFKPTATINKLQQSVRKNLQEVEFALQKGRHDPCVGVRAGVALESRLAIELLNGVLMQQARRVDADNFRLFGKDETS